MKEEKDVIKVNKEVIIHTSCQVEFKATITDVAENLFWIGLPRQDGQVLMLQENQQLTIRIPMQYGFYSAETKLEATGSGYNKFYGLAIPDTFSKKQVRHFLRTSHAANVKFRSGNITAQTTLVNFSAGGVMVYLDITA